MDGLKFIGNVLSGFTNSIPEPIPDDDILPEPIPDDDILPEPPKPKKVPKPKNQFNYQFKKVKPLVLDRDKYTCQECGSKEYPEVHHILYRENGGSNDMGNLITLCMLCHAEKHKGEPVYKIMMKRIRKLRGSR